MILFFLQVQDFHVAKTDKDIGFYAGYIGELITTLKCQRLDGQGFVLVSTRNDTFCSLVFGYKQGKSVVGENPIGMILLNFWKKVLICMHAELNNLCIFFVLCFIFVY